MELPNIMKPDADLMGDAGDRWMRSLKVSFSSEDGNLVLDGYRYEELATALGIRHLCLHPRTRDILAGSIPGPRLRQMVERRWSSIDSFGLAGEADQLLHICSGSEVSWQQQ